MKALNLGLENERRRGRRRGALVWGGRRRAGAESDGDERKAEDLAVEMRDLENEPRQAIVVAFVWILGEMLGFCEGF